VTKPLGTLGIFRPRAHEVTIELAQKAESLGYGTIWLGGSPDADLAGVEQLLDATTDVVIATGVVNMWKDDAGPVADSYHRIAAKHPGRFLLGVGIGHPERTDGYQKPYDKAVEYLDELDAAGVPVQERVLAALGPKMLRLASDRAGGAHPYLVTPEHTRQAREILGDGKLLVPEQKVVLDTDPVRGRATGRARVQTYMQLSNYVTNLRRLGWSDQDFEGGGSDQLVDALVAYGAMDRITEGVQAHLDAGADQVCLYVLNEDPWPVYWAIAQAML